MQQLSEFQRLLFSSSNQTPLAQPAVLPTVAWPPAVAAPTSTYEAPRKRQRVSQEEELVNSSILDQNQRQTAVSSGVSAFSHPPASAASASASLTSASRHQHFPNYREDSSSDEDDEEWTSAKAQRRIQWGRSGKRKARAPTSSSTTPTGLSSLPQNVYQLILAHSNAQIIEQVRQNNEQRAFALQKSCAVSPCEQTKLPPQAAQAAQPTQASTMPLQLQLSQPPRRQDTLPHQIPLHTQPERMAPQQPRPSVSSVLAPTQPAPTALSRHSAAVTQPRSVGNIGNIEAPHRYPQVFGIPTHPVASASCVPQQRPPAFPQTTNSLQQLHLLPVSQSQTHPFVREIDLSGLVSAASKRSGGTLPLNLKLEFPSQPDSSQQQQQQISLKQEEEEVDDQLYCQCRQLYDPSRPMIACDVCDDWYHLECVNLTEQEVNRIDSYVCKRCCIASDRRTVWKQEPVASGSEGQAPSAVQVAAQTKPPFVPAEQRELEIDGQEIDQQSTKLDEALEIAYLERYTGLIQRKKRDDNGVEDSTTAEEDIQRKHTEASHFENVSVDLIAKALGAKANSTQSSVLPQHVIRKFKEGHYLNADLRYFNLGSLGKFDVVLIDPPWRIAGGQGRQESSNMFSNNKWKLKYQTLSNEEIINLDVECLSDAGFCFLWTINSSLQFAMQCLNKWGYNYVDKIVWVKKRSHDKLAVTTGYYLLHSSELLLIGAKYPSKNSELVSNKLQYISKVSNDVLFAEIGIASQKPTEIYEIIESMLPGSRRIEVFARNHNIRPGWLSIGNRLGPAFDAPVTDLMTFSCAECHEEIGQKQQRYKSKTKASTNWCSDCVGDRKSECFTLDTLVDEPVYHDWFTCDNCGMYPICGVRFSCEECDGFDLCEVCYDIYRLHQLRQAKLQQEQPYPDSSQLRQLPPAEQLFSETTLQHKCTKGNFVAVEVPDPGMGFPVHFSVRCSSCLVCPIVGERFHCVDCAKKRLGDVNLCRNCFFKQKEPKQHKHDHEIELIPEPVKKVQGLKCTHCKSKQAPFYLCKTCSNLTLCAECHSRCEELMPFERCATHKIFHAFTKVS